jgi:superfamily II DNA or RNA helicase
MDRFRYGDLTILSSVGVLTEGFDAPAAEVCIMARPTKSLALYIQMGGRVLRPCPETGKTRALIHDHAGNTLRHGFLDDERDYSLKPTQPRIRSLHTCPACYFVFSSLKDGRCPECNELIASPESRSESSGTPHEEIDGRRISREEIEEMRARREGLSFTRELSDRQLAKVATATREEKVAEFLRLKEVAAKKGFKDGFAAHKYRELFGVWPRFTDEQLAAATPAPRPFIPLPPRAH